MEPLIREWQLSRNHNYFNFHTRITQIISTDFLLNNPTGNQPNFCSWLSKARPLYMVSVRTFYMHPHAHTFVHKHVLAHCTCTLQLHMHLHTPTRRTTPKGPTWAHALAHCTCTCTRHVHMHLHTLAWQIMPSGNKQRQAKSCRQTIPKWTSGTSPGTTNRMSSHNNGSGVHIILINNTITFLCSLSHPGPNKTGIKTQCTPGIYKVRMERFYENLS